MKTVFFNVTKYRAYVKYFNVSLVYSLNRVSCPKIEKSPNFILCDKMAVDVAIP